MEKVSLLAEAVRADMILTVDAGKNTFEAVEIADIFAEIGARFLLPTRLDLTRRIDTVLSRFCRLPPAANSVSVLQASVQALPKACRP